MKFNDTLSKERSESGDKVLAKPLKNSGLDIDVAAYGEDWEGLRHIRMIGKRNMCMQSVPMKDSGIWICALCLDLRPLSQIC